MNQPSQPSINQQVTELQKKADIATEIAFNKNAEVQAAQKKLDDLKNKTAAETKRLLKEQTEILVAAKKPLEADIEASKIVLKDIKAEINALQVEFDRLSKEVPEATEALNILNANLAAVRRSLGEQEEALKNLETIIDSHRKEKTQLESDISDLKEEKGALEIDVAALTSEKTNLVTAIQDVQDDLADKEVKRQKRLRLLDDQIIGRTQKLDALRKEEKDTRERFVAWEKELTERDRNLRLRLAKVEQGEERLLANANLMNL